MKEPPSEIDVSRYRTNEVVTRIAEVLSIPYATREVARRTLIAWICTAVTGASFITLGGVTGTLWLVLTAYALILGLPIGLAFGLLRLAERTLSRVEELLGVILELSEQVARDCQGVLAGTTCPPTAGQLIEMVYKTIVQPVVEAAAEANAGFLGGGLVWVYRQTVDRAVRVLLRRVSDLSLSDDSHSRWAERGVKWAEGGAEMMTQWEREFAATAAGIRAAYDLTGRAVRVVCWTTVWPVRVLVFGITALASVPLVAAAMLGQ